MNSMVECCASASRFDDVAEGDLMAVSGGDQTPDGTVYSSALFDQRAVTGVLFYEDGRIVAMVGGRVVGQTGPKPAPRPA